jgi:two-component system response regulator LytT
MKVLIIEDEPLAAERLSILLHQYDPEIKILACIESIEECVNWLSTKTLPDVMLMDIHLSDGHCFEIFNQVRVQVPVIFITAYDHYSLKSFKYFSIDYILKPVSAYSLAAALNKFKSMPYCFQANESQTTTEVSTVRLLPYKERFLGKVGSRSFFIETEDIACFVAENKQVTLVDKKGMRYLVNFTMEKLEPLLNPSLFFRVNRKMIIHSKIIEQVKPYFNSRLKVQLKEIKFNEEIIISRERVGQFKKWAEGTF